MLLVINKRELLVLIEEEAEAGAIGSRVAVMLMYCIFFAFISQYVITTTSLSSQVVLVVIRMRGANTLSIGLI